MTVTRHPFDSDAAEHDDVEAYVLGTLDPEAATAFEARLAASAELQQQVLAARAVTWLLAESPPQLAPRPSLRARVLDAALAEARPAASPADTTTAAPALALPRPLRPATTARPVERWWTRWLLATAAVVVLGLGGWSVSLQQQVARLEAQLERDRAAFAVLAAADRFWTMRGVPERAPEAVSTLALNRRQGQTALVLSGFEPLPSGQVYQIWIVHQGRPQPVTTFSPTPSDRQFTLLLPSDLSGVTGALITIEPAGGSPRPTGVTVMTGDL